MVNLCTGLAGKGGSGSGSAGGVGGTLVGGAGFSSGPGGNGFASSTGGGGGGGSSGGTASNGVAGTSATSSTGGAGGTAPTGGGNGGVGGTYNGADAGAGSFPSGGGGGGCAGGSSTSSARNGAAGADGKVVITPNTGSPTTYSTPGSYTYTVGAGVTSVTIECWGGGGSGSVGTTSTAGHGAGGGWYSKSVVSVLAGMSLSVTVGAGGAANTYTGTAADGNNGTASVVTGLLVPPFLFGTGTDQGWIFNAGGGTGISSGLNALTDSPNDPGSINGESYADRTGKNLSSGTPYYEWSGTWEDLGVPAGATVTAVNLSYDWQCSLYSTGASSTVGPAELRDSGGTLRNTFSTSQAFTATSTWATKSGTNQTGLTDPSNTSIKLRIGAKPNTGSSNSAEVTLLLDYIQVAITYTGPAGVVRRTIPVVMRQAVTRAATH